MTRLYGDRAATLLLVIRLIPFICGKTPTESLRFITVFAEAAVTTFLLDYPRAIRERRGDPAYIYWNWISLRTGLADSSLSPFHPIPPF